jgi:two-component system, cell cycle response regulator
MTNTPLLFSQLADLTAMRDIELMEFSLLKTLNGFLDPHGLKILKIDSKERPCKEIVFNNTQCIVNVEHIDIPEEIKITMSEMLSSGSRDRPINIGDELYTVFKIHQTRALHIFLIIATSKPLSKLNAYLVSGMLQIYKNFCDVLREGQTDQLTGLYNRKIFDESISKVFGFIPVEEEQYPGDQRRQQPCGYWLVMVDIDHFKNVNDKFGHLFGDEVLVLLAQMMMSAFREQDMIFRFGGEEFVFVLRSPDLAGCRVALDRFRVAVEKRTFPQVGTVTISLGACRMQREVFVATLLDYADKALYHSKNNGRNQLTFFEDLVAAGLEKEQDIEPGEITLF